MQRLAIIYEDEHILAVDKSPGVLVVPSAFTPAEDTLLAAAKAHAGARVWALHRLDRDTSGVVLFAKSPQACKSLHHQFEARSVDKWYDAIVKGRVADRTGRISLQVAPGRKWTKARVVVRGGEPALTEYQVKEYCGPVTWLEVHPATGRFHQIRAHLAAIGHPLAFDPLYHKSSPWDWLGRVPLHCARISLQHPATAQPTTITAPFPDDLRKALRRFKSS